MYVCGMTVYDYCHLGHARMMVVFDMVERWLRASGFEVTYVRNITDIDDKIIKRAQENNESIEALTARFIEAMEEDAAALGVMPPSCEPRATQHVERMVAMIRILVDKGSCLRRSQWRRVLCCAQISGLWKTFGKIARRSASGGTRRSSIHIRKIRWILCCGRPRSPANPNGIRPGAWDVPAGISNARR